MQKYMICVLVLGLLSAGRAQAQSNWQNLEKIRAGEQVSVYDTHLGAHAGEFVGFTENDITLRNGGNTIVIPRQEVYRVNAPARGRGRHVGRGLLFGAGIGAGIVAPFAIKYYQGGAYVAPGALIGGGIGALAGLAKKPHGADMYRSNVKPTK